MKANAATKSLLTRWNEAKLAAKVAVEKERLLRDEVVALFGAQEEGTRTLVYEGFAEIKLRQTVDRKVDENLLQEVMKKFPKDSVYRRDSTYLFRWKPELKTKVYKEMPESDRIIFDNALVIRLASPQIEATIVGA